jgi:hypothetical protein
MPRAGRDIDRRIAVLSRPQNGVITRAALINDTIGGGAIKHRLDAGRLIPFVPGVYFVGHAALTPDRLWWAAVLAGGPHARLSGRSALEALALLDPQPAAISVSVPRTHRARTLVAAVTWNGRPVQVRCTRPRPAASPDPLSAAHTAPPVPPVAPTTGLPTIDVHRALVEVAATDPRAFSRAVREAEFQRHITDANLRAATTRGRHGSAATRALLTRRALGAAPVRNDFEDRGVDLFQRLGLPMPETNVWLPTPAGPVSVDFWFALLGLAVEFDGVAGHGSVGGRMRDHSKAARLRAAGIDLMFFNWWQATHAIHEIRGALIGAGYLPNAELGAAASPHHPKRTQFPPAASVAAARTRRAPHAPQPAGERPAAAR